MRSNRSFAVWTFGGLRNFLIRLFAFNNNRKPLNISFVLRSKPVVSRQENATLRKPFFCVKDRGEDFLALCKCKVDFSLCFLKSSSRLSSLRFDICVIKNMQILFKLLLAFRSIPDFPIDILSYSLSARFLYFLCLLGICLCKSPACN